MIKHKKEKFKKYFQNLHPLRFHMTMILLATTFSGVLASKLLLAVNLNNIAIRYPLSVLFAYSVFFICIKLWLFYVSKKKSTNSISDWIDIPVSSNSSSSTHDIPTIHGQGGRFSGAGASSSFDAPAYSALDAPLTDTESSGNIVEGVTETVSSAAHGVDDIEGVFSVAALAVMGVIITIIFGGAFYIITEAPIILSETAFQGLLAASLVKKTRLINSRRWMGSVFKATYIQFFTVLGLIYLASIFICINFPEATRLADIFK